MRRSRAAKRHTWRVRVLRRIMFAGVLCLGAVLAVAFFNPFRGVIPSMSIDSVGLNGTKVTMDRPKLSGFKTDGRPYTLNARSAIQDVRTPSVLELVDLDAVMTMPDKSIAHVVSSSGVYDSSSDSMTFDHDVHVTTDAGVDVRMASGYVEFKNGIVATDQPVNVVINNSTVSANSMHVTQNGKAVSFEGNVRTRMLQPETKTASSLKGAAQ